MPDAISETNDTMTASSSPVERKSLTPRQKKAAVNKYHREWRAKKKAAGQPTNGEAPEISQPEHVIRFHGAPIVNQATPNITVVEDPRHARHAANSRWLLEREDEKERAKEWQTITVEEGQRRLALLRREGEIAARILRDRETGFMAAPGRCAMDGQVRSCAGRIAARGPVARITPKDEATGMIRVVELCSEACYLAWKAMDAELRRKERVNKVS